MLGGSIIIARIAGVPVRVHWTFLILLAWVFGAGALRGGMASGVVAAAFVLAIFACVVAHEFGHVLAARSFGIRTREVLLLPIGGVASLEKLPERPWQELVVALCGPLVNFVIALALLPGLFLSGDILGEPRPPESFGAGFLRALVATNVWLAIFNLIPAFPMDGGRVLRALLGMITDRVSATRTAARVGQAIAVLLALVGISIGHPMLLVLAIFVFLGAGSELAGTEVEGLLKGLPVSAVMERDFSVLGANHSLQRAVDLLLANSQSNFPVTEDGRAESSVIGILSRGDLVRALAEHGAAGSVGDAMRSVGASVAPSDSAAEAARTLDARRNPVVPVVEKGVLVGLLTAENVSEAMMVGMALRRRRA